MHLVADENSMRLAAEGDTDTSSDDEGDGQCDYDLELPELTRVGSLQHGWVPPSGRHVEPSTPARLCYTAC